MTIEDILEKLETHDYATLPREALQEAINQQQAITPHLLAILKHMADDPQWLDENPDYMGFTYALYLLAQFREQRAYQLMADYFSRLGTNIEALDATGDIVTEDLGNLLASVCGGDLSLIKRLIESPQVNEFVRSASLDSLVTLYRHGLLTRAELLDYMGYLIEKMDKSEGYFNSSIVSGCLDIHPDELYGQLSARFDQGYIDPDFVGKKTLIKVNAQDKAQVIAGLKANKQFRLIDDMLSDLSTWACFQPTGFFDKLMPLDYDGSMVGDQDRELMPTTYVRDVKIGRNDPCPCGSGKKYKKCCLQ